MGLRAARYETNRAVSVANFDQLGRLTLTQSLDQGSLNASDITTGTKQQTRYRYSGNNFYQLVSNLYGEATSQSSGNCQNSCVIGWTVTKFDQNGRPVSVTTYDGSSLPPPWGSSTNVTGTTTAAYSGKNITGTEQAGKVQQKTKDALGRLAGVVEDPGGLNYPISYTYDALDNLTGVSQSGQSRTFVRDSLARLSSATNPESGTVSYTYDANGNLLSKLDNLGVTTTYTYDALNRTASKSYSGTTAGITPSVTYTYCNSASCGVSYGVGRLKSIATSQGNATNYTAYNPVGSVLASSQTVGGKSYPFTYSYTPSGAMTQELYPTNRQINYGYLYADRPQSISGSVTTGGVTTNTTYVSWMGWTSSTELSRSLGSLGALITDLRLNARGQLTQFNMLDWNHADNSPYYVHWQWFYNYGGSNNNGNLLSMTEYNSPSLNSAPSTSSSPAVTTNFSYDGVNRLASVSDNSYTRSMCYDAYGNGWVTAYTGNPAVAGNAPREIGAACPAGSGATPYATATNRLVGNSYDSNGNQTIVGGNTVNYDAEGRVSSVVSGSTTLASYQYDGEGRRVQKTAQGGTTNFVYDASGVLVAEYAGATVSKEYVRFHSGYISSNVDLAAIENAAGSGSSCSTCFVIPDQLGNVRLVADNTGHAAARHDYLPFGEEAVADANRPAVGGFGLVDGVKQKFTGKERDSESGLDYFGARYYGSALGRFTSPDDPLLDQYEDDPQSWNLYSYGRNNPLRNIDPTGNACIYSGSGNINDSSNYSDDNSGGQSCSGAFSPQQNSTPSATVNAQQGSLLAAVGTNAFLSFSNAANSYFSFIAPNSQLLSETPTGSGRAAQIGNGIGFAATLIGPGGEETAAAKTIKISGQRLMKVLGMHTGGLAGKSFFHDAAEVPGLIRAAESAAEVPSVGGRFTRTVDAGRTIGTDITTGQPTSVYTVVTDANGNLVTAFPGNPRR